MQIRWNGAGMPEIETLIPVQRIKKIINVPKGVYRGAIRWYDNQEIIYIVAVAFSGSVVCGFAINRDDILTHVQPTFKLPLLFKIKAMLLRALVIRKFTYHNYWKIK